MAMKGRSFAEEAEEAKKAIKVMGGLETNVREVKLPGLDDVRAVIEVRKTMPTPNVYPRKAGTPLKKPLVSYKRDELSTKSMVKCLFGG